MIVLGIETSCDETAAAVYTPDGLRSNVIASQTIHQQYGGVVPELASREHMRLILPIIKKSLSDANLEFSQLEGIAVTYGPGLVGSILVGLNTAKALAYALQLPWVGINHIEGHVFSVYVNHPDLEFPFISLVVSGGHTLLVLVKGMEQYEVLGRTLDDAAGEAFDKVSKMMELGYPGGPIIDQLAAQGDETYIHFPRSLIKTHDYNFSFSGLKTAVLYHLKRMPTDQRQAHIADIVASFQAALIEVLVEKTVAAARDKKVRDICLVGGVARNRRLRSAFQQRAAIEG
ncbi:MAG: tRNA (adenosine(37)-N6)-threonylcarbamoyltransferase complex transferase subunit TsaD, partial [candidate division KSB1 bacterium]|nr:tRNA (adenosine(37)-N6)-threonylcarbamoyltransferase complex transferase subunit TsaD [candidate division KSB1 bacterium]